jgi:hypothetical protein
VKRNVLPFVPLTWLCILLAEGDVCFVEEELCEGSENLSVEACPVRAVLTKEELGEDFWAGNFGES